LCENLSDEVMHIAFLSSLKTHGCGIARRCCH
jgi:hypothetical protein